MLGRLLGDAKALARDETSTQDHISHIKKLRAATKATTQQNVESVLALSSALMAYGISFDDFRWQPGVDPLTLDPQCVRDMDLLSQKVLILLADREGSQSLEFNP